MTTISTGSPARSIIHERSPRLEPISGIAFAVFFVLGVVVSSPPADTASGTKWIADYTGTGHQVGHVATGVMLVLAGLCFLSFMTGLWRKFETASTAGRSNPLPVLASATSAACVAAGGVSMATVSASELVGSHPLPTADVLRFANDFGFGLVAVAGMFAAALAVISLSIHAWRCGVMRRRSRNVGIGVGVLLVASLAFLPIFLLLIWVLVTAIRWMRGSFDTPSDPVAGTTEEAPLTRGDVGSRAARI